MVATSARLAWPAGLNTFHPSGNQLLRIGPLHSPGCPSGGIRTVGKILQIGRFAYIPALELRIAIQDGGNLLTGHAALRVKARTCAADETSLAGPIHSLGVPPLARYSGKPDAPDASGSPSSRHSAVTSDGAGHGAVGREGGGAGAVKELVGIGIGTAS